jgi:propanol-preferring alcohol dehydrogenase
MRAAVLTAPETVLRLVETDVPQPGPGQVLVQVIACGMCFSEVNLLHGKYPFATFPVVPGHEITGIVVAVGAGVAFPAVGAAIGAQFLYSSCGYCHYCVRDDQILCSNKRMSGINVDGGYAEYFLAEAGFVTPLPAELDPIAAAPLMCAGITAYNGLRRAGATAGARVAIIGTGGVGSMAIRFALAMGARVAVISSSRRDEDALRELGVEHVIATAESEPSAALRGWDGGANLVVNTAPSSAAAAGALDGIAPDGTLLLLGYGADPLVLSAMPLVLGRLKVMASPSGSPSDLHDTLTFAAAKGILPTVTPIALDEAPKILEAMNAGASRGRQVITF